jgi:hypothetical protein
MVPRVSIVRALLLCLCVVLTLTTACTRKAHLPLPTNLVTAAPPDLKAWEAYLFYPPITIGNQSVPDPRIGAIARKLGWVPAGTREIPTVLVGVGELPAVRVESIGSFPSYHTRFYANDVLWWDRECSSNNQWLDYFGLQWVPPDTGLFTIRIVVDADNQCVEADETNNVAEFQVHAVPGDFAAGLLEFIAWQNGTPQRVDTVEAGTPVSFVAWSFGRGAYPNIREVMSVGGALKLDQRVALSGGSIWPAIRADTVRFVPQTAGSYVCRLALDPDREYPQQSSADDEATATLEVTPGPMKMGADGKSVALSSRFARPAAARAR